MKKSFQPGAGKEQRTTAAIGENAKRPRAYSNQPQPGRVKICDWALQVYCSREIASGMASRRLCPSEF
jgi:hypothetical protein